MNYKELKILRDKKELKFDIAEYPNSYIDEDVYDKLCEVINNYSDLVDIMLNFIKENEQGKYE